MQSEPSSPRLSVSLLVVAMLFSANFSAAQQDSQNSSRPAQQSPPQSVSHGVTIDPSAGPLQPSEPAPVESQTSEAPLPNAPQPAPVQQQSLQAPAQSAIHEPLGAAAAEQVKTAGGAASRPAGNAIAPVKQHQYRSLVIKLGAVAAAGIAAGTVYGLSRATPSTPPHSTATAAK
jgi:hypothetical protein